MTPFDPSKPIALETAGGIKLRNIVVEGDRILADKFWHGEWIKSDNGWALDGSKYYYGEPSMQLVNVPAPAAVDWGKALAIEAVRHPETKLTAEYVKEIYNCAWTHLVIVTGVSDGLQIAQMFSAEGYSQCGRYRIINTPPAPRTVTVEVAIAWDKAFHELIATRHPGGGIGIRHLHGGTTRGHYNSLEDAERNNYHFGPWQSVVLEVPEVKHV